MMSNQLSCFLDRLRTVTLAHGANNVADAQLLDAFISRKDAAAFEALMRRHGPMVWGVCRRVLRHPDDAEDAFQATFLVLVRKAASIVPRAMVGNWLYGVAYRTAWKARRASVKRRMKEKQVSAMPESEAAAEDRCNDLQPLLDQELERLPDKYRTAIVLCDLQGKTHKEAARELGWPVGTLSTRLTRGRALLARRLIRRGLTFGAGTLAAGLIPNAASAGLPSSLLSKTIAAANLALAGQVPVAGVISSKIISLTEEVLRAMLLTKLKIVTAALLVMGVASAGLGLYLSHTPTTGQVEAGSEFSQTARKNEVSEKREIVPRFLHGEKGDRRISFLTWGPEGKTLAAVTWDEASEDGGLVINGTAVKLWDVESGRIKRTLVDEELEKPVWGQGGFAFSPDGKTVASGAFQGESKRVVLWDAETGKVKHRVKQEQGFFNGVSFSPDGRTLAVAGTEGKDPEGKDPAFKLWEVQTGRLIRTLETADKRASSPVFSPHGKRLAAERFGGDSPSDVALWDVASGKCLLALSESDGFYPITFLHDGKNLRGFAPKMRKLREWDIETGKVTRTRDLSVVFSDQAPTTYAFSPDGETLAVSADRKKDGLAILVDLETGKQKGILKAPSGPDFAWSPNGRMLASGSREGKIYLWGILKK